MYVYMCMFNNFSIQLSFDKEFLNMYVLVVCYSIHIHQGCESSDFNLIYKIKKICSSPKPHFQIFHALKDIFSGISEIFSDFFAHNIMPTLMMHAHAKKN